MWKEYGQWGTEGNWKEMWKVVLGEKGEKEEWIRLLDKIRKEGKKRQGLEGERVE